MSAPAPGSQRERMLAGEWYLPGDPELAEDRRRAVALLHRFGALAPTDRDAADALLRTFLGGLGAGTEVLAPLHCDYGHQITIGPRSFINVGAVILDSAEVRIGADVQIGPGVRLITPTHPLDPDRRRAGWERSAPVSVGDGAWLATNVMVCPGVSIGAGAVIGSASLVTRDMPAGYLCHGSPCRPVRPIAEPGSTGEPELGG